MTARLERVSEAELLQRGRGWRGMSVRRRKAAKKARKEELRRIRELQRAMPYVPAGDRT